MLEPVVGNRILSSSSILNSLSKEIIHRVNSVNMLRPPLLFSSIPGSFLSAYGPLHYHSQTLQMGQFKESLVVFFLCYFKFKTLTFLGKIFKQDSGYFWPCICQKRGSLPDSISSEEHISNLLFQITNFLFFILYIYLQGCYMTNCSSKVFSTLAELPTAFSISFLSRILVGFWEIGFLAVIFFNLLF